MLPTTPKPRLGVFFLPPLPIAHRLETLDARIQGDGAAHRRR